MLKKKRNQKKKGFTLIELIIVIAIIAILAALIVPGLMGTKSKAQLSVNRQSVREITNALQEYFAEHDEYPAAPANADDLFKTGGALAEAFDEEVPSYKNGTSIVVKYVLKNAATTKDDYELYLNDDTGTSGFNESEIVKASFPAAPLTPTMVNGAKQAAIGTPGTGYITRKYKYDKLFK